MTHQGVYQRIVLLAVPGIVDRAFYKAFIKAIAEKHNLEYVDLDSRKYSEERQYLINEIAPQGRQSIILRRVSAAKLLQKGDTSTAIVIWPMGG